MLPGFDTRVTIDGNIYPLAGEYRLHDWQSATLSAYAGGRYYDIEATLQASGGLLSSPVEATASTTWTDAIIGARIAWDFAENWRLRSGFARR